MRANRSLCSSSRRAWRLKQDKGAQETFFAPPHRTHCTPTFHMSQPALAVHTQISASPPPLFAYSQLSFLHHFFSFTLFSSPGPLPFFFLTSISFFPSSLTPPLRLHTSSLFLSPSPPPHLLIIILSISLDISFPLEAFGPENCLFVFLSSSLSLLFHPPFSSLSVLKRWYRIASSVFTAFFPIVSTFSLSSIFLLSLYLSISLFSWRASTIACIFLILVIITGIPGRSLAAFFLRRCRVSFQAFSIFCRLETRK